MRDDVDNSANKAKMKEDDQTMALDDDARQEMIIKYASEEAAAIEAQGPPPPRRRVSFDELEGETIDGRFRVIRRVGKGGMGVVYLAQQTNLNRDVCIKVLNPDLIEDGSAIVRFEREAKGLSRLQHPNIVTIFDYGRDGNLAYIVMEYAQGETLSRYIKAHAPMTFDEFLPIAVQTLKGIGEAHKLGLIHRDIKPANIVLCELEGERNFVKILDFGLAKLAQGQEDVTKDQQLIGSASFMAPEQIIKGQSDARTDVYALGIMFYMMLAGTKPITGTNDNVILYKHVNETPLPLSEHIHERQGIPPELCDVVDQCLSKDPNMRPQSALALLDAFSFALDAPQLKSAWSSMSLGSIDLLKMSEEFDTRIMSQSQRGTGRSGEFKRQSGEQRPVLSAADAEISSTISATALSSQQNMLIPSQPSFPNIAISDPNVAPIFDASIVSRKLHDRRILILLIAFCVVVLVVLFAVLHTLRNTEPVVDTLVLSDESSNDDIYKEIEKGIELGRWQLAEDLLSNIHIDDNTDSTTILKVSKLKTQIAIGRLLSRAQIERQQGDDEAAAKLYQQVLAKDSANAEAKAELLKLKDVPKEVVVDVKKALFNLDFSGDRSAATLYIDDVRVGSVPETLELDVGTYAMRIVSPGYKDWTETIEATADGKVKTIVIAAEKVRRPSRTGTKPTKPSSDLLLGGSKRGGDSGLLLK